MARRPAKVMELSQGDRALLEVWSRAAARTHRTAFEFEFAVSLVGIGGAMGFYRAVSRTACTGTECLTLLVQVLMAMAFGLLITWAGWRMMSAIGHEVRVRRFVRRRMAEYQAGNADAVSVVHEVGFEQLREEVEAHRLRTMVDSEWSRARASLATALDEVEGTIAQWAERISEGPDSELAIQQLRPLRKLKAKLRSACREVDGRNDVLRQFYQRLEAKLAIMDRSNTDLTRVKRLGELSGKANIAEAKGTVEALAQGFLAEAQDILHVLGSVDRSQLGSPGGFASYDNVELLADKIHEASKRDRGSIRQMGEMLEE